MTYNAICPSCHKSLTFLTYSGHYKFVRYGRKCKSCSHRTPPHTEEQLTRTCASCGRKKIYKCIGDKNAADKYGYLCKSCAGRLKNGMMGRHHSKSSREKISKNNFWKGKHLSDVVKQKIRVKLSGSNNPFYGKKHTSEALRKNIEKNRVAKRPPCSEETKLKLRLKRLEWLDKCGYVGSDGKSYNPKGCEYIDNLNKCNHWNLQHALNGGEVRLYGYSVDGYDQKQNIVVEYDEPAHYDGYGRLRKKDVTRMNRIIENVGCQFYRYNEKLDTLTKYS